MDVTLDDFHCYTADYALTDALSVETDSAALLQNSFYNTALVSGYVLDSLALPTEGSKGSSISWSSDHPGVIAEDGWLTRPDSDTAVTMTATLTKGEASATKSFTFTVPGKKTVVGDLPLVADMKFYASFNDNVPGSQISLPPGNGIAAEMGGVLQLVKNTAAGITSADIYLNEDRSAAMGQFVTEFILTRKTQTVTSAIFTGENIGMGAIAFLLNWWDNGNNIVNLQYANAPGGSREDHILR